MGADERCAWITGFCPAGAVPRLEVAAARIGFARELFRAREQGRANGLRDSLTGLPNRLLFNDRLQQAISNLVGNALEHSDSVVTIRVIASATEAAVSVHNMGPAIPADELPRLFEAFRKREKRATGLGLGLYIVKEIASAHGGTVRVESTDAGGTTFAVVVPRFPSK